MDENIDLRAKFPNLKPISGPPSLFLLNGCGLTIYGRRDADRETRSYVTTQCIALVFIPIYWLCAYRVRAAGSNSYFFLGREPLSGFCKIWNLFLISGTLVLSGASIWEGYTKSPEYIASRMLDQARALKAKGKIADSLSKFAEVLARNTKQAAAAKAELLALIQERFDVADAKDAQAMLHLLLNHHRQGMDVAATTQWYTRARSRVAAISEKDAREARRLLALAAPLAPDKDAHQKAAEELLQNALQQNPADLALLTEWAVILEARDETAALKALLEPRKDSLGGTECARMLGQIYAHEGKIDDSFALLEPYTRQGLDALNKALAHYEVMHKQVVDNTVSALRAGRANQIWYRQYEAASEARKQELVDTYIQGELRVNTGLKAAEKAIEKESRIVPVALDLGIVRLYRAQSIADPAAKKKELEAAEQVFLAIRGSAGDSDQYLLYYGQVLFWLGRTEEGRKQFDQLLAKNNRAPVLLLKLADVLRELGETSAVTTLLEEAYESSKEPAVKQEAAQHLAIVSENLDEKIIWLGRSDAKSPHVRADLLMAQGDKDLQVGDRAAAAAKYREAISLSQTFQRNSTSLNNTGILYSSLFAASGDREDYRRAVDLQLEALALEPQNAILMHNTAAALQRRAMLDILGPTVNFARASASPSLEYAGLLYDDEAGRNDFVRKLAAHKDIVQAVSILQRLLLLSPRSERSYAQLQAIYSATDNFEGMRELRERLKTVTLDTDNSRSASRRKAPSPSM